MFSLRVYCCHRRSYQYFRSIEEFIEFISLSGSVQFLIAERVSCECIGASPPAHKLEVKPVLEPGVHHQRVSNSTYNEIKSLLQIMMYSSYVQTDDVHRTSIELKLTILLRFRLLKYLESLLLLLLKNKRTY